MPRNQVTSLNMNTKFKRTPIGDLPVDWEVVPLETVAEVTGGGTPDRSNSKYWNGNIPWATPSDITALENNHISSTKDRITQLGLENSSARLLPSKSILMTSRATIGYCAINDVPMATNQGFINFVVNDKAVLEYLFYVLVSKKKDFERLGAGSTFLEISKSAIRRAEIQLPPVTEQKQIARILASIDTATDISSVVIEKTKQLKKALMQQLLTGNTPQWRGKNKWTEVSLCEIAKLRIERIKPNSNDKQILCIELEHMEQGGGRIIGSARVSDQTSLKSKFRAGDILFGKLRAYLRKYWLADRDGVCSTEIWVLVPEQRRVIPEYLYQIVQTQEFIDAASVTYGTHMPRSDWDVVGALRIQLPELQEQREIADALHAFDSAVEKEDSHLHSLNQLKTTLMQLLLTGKIRVR